MYVARPGKIFPRPARILPEEVRKALIQASLVDPMMQTSSKRIAAIDRATAWAKLKYPQFFKGEENHEQ